MLHRRACLLAEMLASVFLIAESRGHAQLLQVTKGDYWITAQTQAFTESDMHTFSDTIMAPSYSKSLSAYSSYTDAQNGENYASANSALNWNSDGVSSLSGGVGGVAQGVSNGVDTYATAAATVSVYFNILTTAQADIDSEGTYNSDLYVFDGSAYVPFYTGINGVDQIRLASGAYRWDAGAGASISGYDYYSAGIFFSITATPVPEPGSSLLVIGIATVGASILRSRRKKAA